MGSYRLDLLCTGTALVDSIIRGFDPQPVSARGYRAQSGTLSVGGEAVNEATAAARLGLTTGILCFLGRDAAGELVRAALKENGVDISAVVRSENPTPVSTLIVAGDGSRKSVTNDAHRYNFHPERYPEILGSARAVTLGSLFRAPYSDPDTVRKTLEACGDALIFADTKVPDFRRLTPEDIPDAMRRIDYLFPNEDEARYFTGKADPDEMAETFLGFGVRNVIVKLGLEGCLYRGAAGRIRLPGHRIDAVDATGAGDCFLAGFASEILRGASVEDALAFANACGAICTTAVGAGTALRSREQVLEFLDKQP